jgi:hypothetical protein
MVTVEHPLKWGHIQTKVRVAKIRGRHREPQATWLREEIRSLASVCGAIRKGALTAYTSIELSTERMRSSMNGQGLHGDLWVGIHLGHVESPLDRSTWMGGLTVQMMTSDDNKAALAEFAKICKAVGRSRYGDAFHYWTAICNNKDYFLTTDRVFLQELRKHSEIADLVYRAVTPSELVGILNLLPVELPVREGEVVPFEMH